MTTKKKVRTSLLTPLQVQEAIILWAQLHKILDICDARDLDIKIGEDGWASIKKTTVQP